METRLTQKIETLLKALTTLADSIEFLNECSQTYTESPTHKNNRSFLSARDSMIQRFEYCTDLFWKVIRLYLENIEKLNVTINSPRGILRQAVNARLLSEDEGAQCMEMVESRNRTSHIYHHEVAEEIAEHIPAYYHLMSTATNRLADSQ